MAARKYSKLFEPISIGKVEIKNRIAMALMAIGGLTTRKVGLPRGRSITNLLTLFLFK